MGCCLSNNKAKGEKRNSGGGGGGWRDPPPTESPQEEKVKEVLSETPKISNQSSAARSVINSNVSNGGAKTRQLDVDEYYYPEVRSEAETSTTAASEQSTTTTSTSFADQTKARPQAPAEEEEEERSVRTKKKKKKKQQPAGGGGGSAAARGGRKEMRGSVVDVGCRSARSSSPSPQLIRALAPPPTKRSADLGERSGRRCASAANAAPAMPMHQRQCRLMSSTPATNGRYCSPQRIPATSSSSRPVDLGGLLGPGGKYGNHNNADRPVPAPAANWSSGKLLEAPSPSLLNNRDPDQARAQEQEESLENPLVSLECFIFL